MPHEVIMPALGMAQETGRIVAWLKAAGDRVSAGEPIMEVETDKAVMEVEAAVDGILAGVRAEAGTDVPVGDVVAVIAGEGEEIAADEVPASKAEEPAEPLAEVGPGTPVPPTARSTVPEESARILASPKARRLAKEQGLDLKRLVEAGHPQPYHAADLDRISAVPVTTIRIEAWASGAALLDFGEDMSRMAASFAARILRTEPDGKSIHIQVERPGAGPVTLADPDFPRSATADVATPALILRDLTATALQRLPVTGALPTLTLSRQGNGFLTALDCRPGAMSPSAAEDLVTQFTARLEDPLTHLL